MNALCGQWRGEGYPRRPQPAASRRRATLKSRAPSGRASVASDCGRTGITRLRQLRRDRVVRCALREKRASCSLRRGRNVILPGQYYDQETGLSYNYRRDYDPAVGRYVESDPIGLHGGSYSTYVYVNDDPIVKIDPTGLAVQWTGSVSAFGATVGVGGQLLRFTLESECKCNKKYTISGFASFLTVGAGAKWSGVGEALSDAGLNHGHAEFTDPWDDCPNPDAANGVAWVSGINVVAVAGASFLSTLNLGWLHSQSLADPHVYGADISIQSGMGASAVTSVQQSSCCSR